jgi:hypothetical protein
MNKDLARLWSRSKRRANRDGHSFLTPEKRFLKSKASAILGLSDTPELCALRQTSRSILAEWSIRTEGPVGRTGEEGLFPSLLFETAVDLLLEAGERDLVKELVSALQSFLFKGVTVQLSEPVDVIFPVKTPGKGSW